ncbi:MAG: cobalamin biosynthesis protein CobD [Desulfuromonas sp.]|nr:MAG: cobalamin biosynthesis protein CobD [Desulfuromonas sp.]
MDIWLLLAAFALDLLVGDPRFMHHPVIYIGTLINWLELLLASMLDNRKLAGFLLCGSVVAVTGGLTWLVLLVALRLHPVIHGLISLYLAYTTIALRQLHIESREVVHLVERGQLDAARRSLSLIVGRDTAKLDEEQILQACIETVSENTSDGVIAPLFYLFLGGPVLAMIYKAANTLDSMVGYRDDRYREMGWVSARFDDLLNLVPARLTGLLMVIASFPLALNPWAALKVMLRDARKTSSPNAGYPEAAAAGALGIQLGGPARYFGEMVEKPFLGDPDRQINIGRYRAMIRLMYVTAFLTLGLGVFLSWLFQM